jgi:hypothetical protein
MSEKLSKAGVLDFCRGALHAQSLCGAVRSELALARLTKLSPREQAFAFLHAAGKGRHA